MRHQGSYCFVRKSFFGNDSSVQLCRSRNGININLSLNNCVIDCESNAFSKKDTAYSATAGRSTKNSFLHIRSAYGRLRELFSTRHRCYPSHLLTADNRMSQKLSGSWSSATDIKSQEDFAVSAFKGRSP